MTPLQTLRSLLNPEAVKNFGWRAVWTKFTFLAFCWAGLFIFLGMGFLFYFLIDIRLQAISPLLDKLALVALIVLGLVVSGGLFLITLTALTGIDLLYPHGNRSVTVKVLFPIAATLSHFSGSTVTS